PISRWIILRMMRTDTVTLVNLVSETRAVPEFIAGNCRPELMAAALAEVLADGPVRQAQLDAMALTLQRLGQGGEPPGHRAARSVLAAITAPRPR
ncbi:MAG: lipid-A-disaccharide synthase, partial [Paracoccus sp. (in: a-proteobacteria)]|nr:lipid-A-disaccharide synthase [Paracoccus sp. (in: a-proteobacteria)]